MSEGPVYRGLSQAELDAQYDQRTLVPDAARYMARWAEWSAAAPPPAGRLRYGEGADEWLDLYGPAGGPAVLFLHGGAWRQGRAGDFGFVAQGLGADGAQVAVAEFSLAPAVPLARMVDQVRRALVRLAAEAGPVVVAGHSSGAHLAACLLDPRWRAATGGEPLAGLALVSGVYDLEPVRLSARNAYLSLSQEEAARLSPIETLPERPPPVALAWGDAELAEFVRQSEAFAEALRARGGAVSCVEVAGANHFEMCDAFADPSSAVATLARGLMERA